jgi:D-alanyl-D-alanine carboxypeptidase-like protein
MARAPASARAVSVALIAALCITVFAGSSALASHLSDWTHDHSDAGVPPRPSGLAGLNNVFGARCSDKANNARSWWPNADTDPFGAGKYVYYHTYLARNIGFNIRNHINAAHLDGALYPGIGGYNCRLIDGSTSWSVHSWGAAVDTNWQRNPRYQTYWNGRGIDGENHGTYIPDVWRGGFPGHRFLWGLSWDSAPDPMHFQYVTNY